MRFRILIYLLIAFTSLAVGTGVGYVLGAFQSAALSPYVDQQTSPIRGLRATEVDDLLNGRGAGYARTAELNSYPGPRHLLDFAIRLELTAPQKLGLEQIFTKMQTEAQSLGVQIVEAETLLSGGFATQAIAQDSLALQMQNLGSLYADLRAVHLAAHLESRALLTNEQVMRYNQIRGYDETVTNGDPHHSTH